MMIGAMTAWQPPPRVLGTLAALFAALLIGTALRLLRLSRTNDEAARRRWASLVTWWALTLIAVAALLSGATGVSILLCCASGMAYLEFARLTGMRQGRMGCAVALAGLLALHATILALDARLRLICLVPAVLVAGGAALSAWSSGRRSAGSIGWLVWGGSVLLGGPACALLLYADPARHGFSGPTEAVLCLLILTELNDIAQALIGRRFGATHVTPVISPRKTWEGLLGGMLSTALLAALLILWLGSGVAVGDQGASSRLFPHLSAAVVGLGVAVSGFLGDINMSAYKRAAGIKDAGAILPGQGGVLDRIDSLTLTAPVFYCSTSWLLGHPAG
jgi:phosphatidate cytidylyltransferase